MINHTPTPERELCTMDGATHIAAKLRAYWFARGHVINVAIVSDTFQPSLRYAPQYVRTDMINGLPRTHPANRARQTKATLGQTQGEV